MILEGKALNTACSLFYCHIPCGADHEEVLIYVFIYFVKFYLIFHLFQGVVCRAH